MSDALLSEIGTGVFDLYNRLGRFTGQVPSEAKPIAVNAGSLTAALYRRVRELEDPATAPAAARAIMAVLHPYVDPPDRFWATETGRAVALAVGFHRERCPYAQAAAILNVSRQRIYQLANEGRLVRIEDAQAVASTSVREELLRHGRRVR